MAHEVETMAYTNEVPWHGLGFAVDKDKTSGPEAVEYVLNAAKLNWLVKTESLFRASGEEISTRALVRESDDRFFGVVGKSYVPVQNHQAFSFFNEFVSAGDATMETAGSLRGGRYVWGLANLGQSFKLAGDDEIKGYLLVGSPHEQGRSLIMKFTPIRVVCNNTLTFALNDPSSVAKSGRAASVVKHVHRNEFDEGAVEAAKVALGVARDQMWQFQEQAETLTRKYLGADDCLKVLQPIFAPDYKGELVQELVPPTLKKLMDINLNAPGAKPGTAWGLLNAATYYLDHSARRSPDSRLTSAWFGHGASQKLRLMNVLIDA